MISQRSMASPLYDPYWQAMPREELDAYHLQQIKKMIRFAYERVPFYRQLYQDAGLRPEHVKTWDDFYQHVPILDKPMISQDQVEYQRQFGFEALPPTYRRWFHRTSGTTGTPLNEVVCGYDRMVGAYDCWTWGWWDVGLRPGDSIYFPFSYGTFIGFWSANFAAERMGLTVIPGGGLSTEQRIQQILDLRPSCVCGTPTYLLHIIHVARGKGIDLRTAGVKVLTMAGESGGNVPSLRQALRDGWGNCEICDIYGISELIFGSAECRRSSQGKVLGVHTIERYCHTYSADPESFEPIFEDGVVGENIVTVYRLSQPLIKYRSHDLVRLYRHHEHGCGWTWTFLEGGVLGRTDFMVTVRGVNVYPTAVENLLGQVRGLSPYYELHIDRVAGNDRMTAVIEADVQATEGEYEQMKAAAERLLASKIGVSIRVQVQPAGSLPRYELKSKKIIDHRKGAKP